MCLRFVSKCFPVARIVWEAFLAEKIEKLCYPVHNKYILRTYIIIRTYSVQWRAGLSQPARTSGVTRRRGQLARTPGLVRLRPPGPASGWPECQGDPPAGPA
jgi:hypothetical protein